jgi:hypothetical protein
MKIRLISNLSQIWLANIKVVTVVKTVTRQYSISIKQGRVL